MSESPDPFVVERARPWGLAYRMLGSRADADDVVQDAWLRWNGADQTGVANPAAWLTTVASRLAVDRLRVRSRERQRYVGPWLPEPVLTGEPLVGSEDPTELADSLSIGFLAMLERLEPIERVVFLLSDVFDEPFRDIANVVDRSEAACRQIASRARRRVRDERRIRTFRPSRSEADRLVEAFCLASVTGDLDGLSALLDAGVVLVSDGGAHAHAARRPVVGRPRVIRLITNLTKRMAPRLTGVRLAQINGEPGVILDGAHGPIVALAFDVGTAIENIYAIVNQRRYSTICSARWDASGANRRQRAAESR